ncbi:VOC family protein [Phenylobacterium conjunctum]|jgi:catechol 2,3-dioxygenase-like lactoylglutathione lyase family enzyme|uniref:VOC family protein n=1 Tax=Phenylobacterium conjunctum TaxID=1298959 RepID=A0ABW3T4N2_9CAUL
MLDHIGLTVADYGRSRAFFDAALKPLGVSVMMEVTAEQTGGHAHCGYGAEMKPFFWFGTGGPPTAGVHVAFTAKDRATVDAFYAAAMAAGGRDNGPPGIRAHYHPTYYGAFVLDPDGHNVEAVCHAPA